MWNTLPRRVYQSQENGLGGTEDAKRGWKNGAMPDKSQTTASEWWKVSGRLEWRRLESVASARTTAGTLTAQDSWLSTMTVVRRLDRDWTALARNYYLATDNHGARANGWQDRFQVGLAWRRGAPLSTPALNFIRSAQSTMPNR